MVPVALALVSSTPSRRPAKAEDVAGLPNNRVLLRCGALGTALAGAVEFWATEPDIVRLVCPARLPSGGSSAICLEDGLEPSSPALDASAPSFMPKPRTTLDFRAGAFGGSRLDPRATGGRTLLPPCRLDGGGVSRPTSLAAALGLPTTPDLEGSAPVVNGSPSSRNA